MTKKEALAIVFSCAAEYKENLVDHSLLFLCQDKHKNTYCLEVTFNTSNFQHLTGFKTEEIIDAVGIEGQDSDTDSKLKKRKMNAAHFFELCIDHRLSENDFEFAEDGTTPMKMRVLPSAVKKNLSANMVGYYNGSQPRLYTEQLAGGVKGCVGFKKDKCAGRFVPNTLLEGDIRTKVTRPDRILVTYRKKRDEEAYSEIVYAAKKVDFEKIKIPNEYSYLPLPVAKSTNEETTAEQTVQITEAIHSIAEKESISGELKKARETVINLHNMEMDIECIAKVVNVDIVIVEQWVKEISE